jgi:hypothetical protein
MNPSPLHRRPLYVVLPGPYIQMMFGGKKHIFGIPVGSATRTPQMDTANALASHFTSVFSSGNNDPSFELSKTMQKHYC